MAPEPAGGRRARGAVAASPAPRGPRALAGALALRLPSALAALALAVGCSGGGGARGPVARPPAPAFLGPGEFLPADLDLVVRLDAARLRSLASDPPMRALLTEYEEGHPWLKRALGMRAASIWVGFRGEPDGARSDTVLIVQGDLRAWKASLESGAGPERPWRLKALPAPGLSVYERAAVPSDRGSPVRLALVRERIGVLASAAEADAVDRILGGGPEAERLEPPADGALGFALRPRSLVGSIGKGYPALARLMVEARSVRGGADFEADSLRADATVEFRSEEAAERSERVLRAALGEWGSGEAPRLGALARSSSLRREGPTIVRWVVRARGDDARTIAGLPPPSRAE
ncbi:MAG TPA: hypothetical protein VFS43_44945 [Polyangiaceae bacterium]|nr:hypothetical protein [Polyangiaceae bacterium]